MTSTPTIWKAPFIANVGATVGGQSVPQTIGLANGNFLVVWEDTSNGPSPFIDIMGRMFNAEGTALGAPFQLNSAVVASDETGPKIVAMPDGGYVVAYGSYLEALGGFIGVERFDANGFSVSSRFITDPVSSLTEWDLTVDSAGNYTVAYERLQPHAIGGGNVVYSQDIFSRTYDGLTNAAGPENSHVAQNSAEVDELGAVATFANGHIVTFYNEPDYDFFGNKADTAEYSIIDPVSGTQIRNPVEIDGPDWDDDAIALDVACLAYGPFVLLYWFNDTYAFRIGESDAPGSAMSSRNTVATFGALGGARVVALNEGGFFVEWLESTAHILYGQRYAATGAPIGSLLLISTNVGSIGQSDMSLTSDGRILVPFRDLGGEINTVILDPRENTIYGTDNNDQLTTQISSSVIYGFGGDDFIYGQNGNDRVDGGTGLDVLSGGKGGDYYVLNDADRSTSYAYDTVVELANSGYDTVEVMSFFRSSPSSALPGKYTLPDNVEEGAISGVDTFQLTGNALSNYMTGNSGSNVLDGKSGQDHMAGGLGNDLYYVDDLGDVVVEAAGDAAGTYDYIYSSISLVNKINVERLVLTGTGANTATGLNGQSDYLIGNAASNVLTGFGGDDTLNGGLGADTLNGGENNDTYYVDNAGDIVTELAGAANGTYDIINAAITFTIAANVERLNLAGTADINATGLASQSDVLVGNNGENILTGLAGNDTLIGGGGVDTMIGGLGNDSFYVDNIADVATELATQGTDSILATVSCTIQANIERLYLSGISNLNATGLNSQDDQLFGNTSANKLTGLDGNDLLDGKAGVDTMIGGNGNDSYYVDSASDVVTETAGAIAGTTDNIYTTVSITNRANVERVTLLGVSNLNVTGLDAQGDILFGNSGANILNGKDGADILVGGFGNDTLTGGLGSDSFRFDKSLNAVTNKDTITDYSVASDTLQLDNAVFAELFSTLGNPTSTGILNVNLFGFAASADANDRVIYNATTGELSYDINGNIAGGATVFAQLSIGLALTATDFYVI